MKKLIFIRHAKAEDLASEISDFERSLTLKGKSISRQMARKLKETEPEQGMILTSPAFRAMETAFIFTQEFGIKPEKIIIDSNLYYKMSFRYLLEILSLVNEDIKTVTLFGHNPSFTEIPGSLCKGGCDFNPKCGVIGISFNIMKWAEIKQNSGKLEYFLKPEKNL